MTCIFVDFKGFDNWKKTTETFNLVTRRNICQKSRFISRKITI